MDGDGYAKRYDDTPGHRVRHDGWTPQRQRVFLRALGETGCVRDACARARISSTAAYRMRQRSMAFERAWQRALAKAAPTLEQAAFERAVLGWDEPVWHAGKLVGHRRRYSDNLLRLLILSTRRAGDGRPVSLARLIEIAHDAARAAGGDFTTPAQEAETDALLRKNLRALRRRREAGRLPPPAAAGTAAGEHDGDGDAGDDDRWPDDAVRDGHDA